MSRRKRLSLAAEALADLEEISPEELQGTRAARALELQQENQDRQNELDKQTPNLQGDQLSAYIQSCVKLSQDNKITIRNAFDVQLIDYMISFAKEEKDGDSTNFSLASMTLDASGKIYGYRVDAVHQDVFRLVSGMGVGKTGGSGEPNGDAGIPDAPDGIDQAGDDVAKKVRKRRVRSTYVAEESANQANIEIDYEISGNDVLTAVHHNDGNALGRIMSYNLVPEEMEPVDIEGSAPWWHGNVVDPIEDTPCAGDKWPAFPDYLPLSTYLLEQNMDATLAVDTSSLGDDRAGQDAMDVDPNGNHDLNDSVVFDPEAEPLPVAEDDALDKSNFGLGPDGTVICERTMLASTTFDQATILTSFSLLDRLKSEGLNFAGPGQFKMRRFNILGHEKKPPLGTVRPTRAKRSFVYITYNDENTFESFVSAQPTMEKSKKKGTAKTTSANCLTSMTMDRWTSDTTTLTVEFTPSSFERLTRLFELPAINVRHNKRQPTEDLGEDRLIEYRDDADDRPVSPCADDHFSELGRDAEHIDRDFNIENIEAVDNDFNVPCSQPADDEVGYDNLLAAPGIVAEKLVIAYTKAAKKFNVRQMKESYWKVLTECTEKAEVMEGEKRFSELYSDVQPHLSQMNRKNVSLPLAFVSLLLLCNEKHLMLRPENGQDFFVYQASNPYK